MEEEASGFHLESLLHGIDTPIFFNELRNILFFGCPEVLGYPQKQTLMTLKKVLPGETSGRWWGQWDGEVVTWGGWKRGGVEVGWVGEGEGRWLCRGQL